MEVFAAGVNRADVLQRQGHYPAPPRRAARRAGPRVRRHRGRGRPRGRRPARPPLARGRPRHGPAWAAARSPLSCWSPPTRRCPCPSALTLEQAAATPEAFLTAWDALRARRGCAPARSCWCTRRAAASAPRRCSSRARAAPPWPAPRARRTSSSAAARWACSTRSSSRAPTGRRPRASPTRCWPPPPAGPADVILDVVGAAYLDENLRALAPRGRLLCLGLLGGATGRAAARAPASSATPPSSAPRCATALTRRRPRWPPASARRCCRCSPTAASRRWWTRCCPMSEVRAAHERVERGDVFGKLVLRW